MKFPGYSRRKRFWVQGPQGEAIAFNWKTNSEPYLEHCESNPPTLTWKKIWKYDATCKSELGGSFLYLDIRTPYGESVGEEQVIQAMREALGSHFERFALQGWHVTHLEDTHLGSNHRVFATLIQGTTAQNNEPWDFRFPLELALDSLGEWLAKRTGHSEFQLVIQQNAFVYSLIYRDAQSFHTLCLPISNHEFLFKRLSEQRLNHRKTSESNSLPLYFEGTEDLQIGLEDHLKLKSVIVPAPLGISPPANLASALWALGLVLATAREETGHNLAPISRHERNFEIRTLKKTAKYTVFATLLGLSFLIFEAGLLYRVRKQLDTLHTQAKQYSDKVKAIQKLRNTRAALTDSLTKLKPLWNRPIPVDLVLRAIAKAVPEKAGIEGIMLRKNEGKIVLSFRAFVEDWNGIRPFQERLQKLSYFVSVDFSDQRKDLERHKIAFQATCILANSP